METFESKGPYRWGLVPYKTQARTKFSKSRLKKPDVLGVIKWNVKQVEYCLDVVNSVALLVTPDVWVVQGVVQPLQRIDF